MIYNNRANSVDLRTSVAIANAGISTLVSALSYQTNARISNQYSCDYCGERYPTPGPIAWASHMCKVLTAAETIISECVQHILRERFIAKTQLERYLADDDENASLPRSA